MDEQRIQAAWNSFPEAPRILCQILVGIWIVGLFLGDALIDLLALIPTQTFHLVVWNIGTYFLYDTSVISTIFNCLAILMIGRHLEPVWGAREFYRFVGVSALGTGILTLTLATLFSVIFDEDFWTDYYCGALGVIAAMTVALKQLNPDFEIQFWFVPLRYKYFPMALASWSVMTDILFTQKRVAFMDQEEHHLVLRRMRASSTPLVFFGIFTGWLYLRFFQSYLSQSHILGDSSESMAFHTLFPEFLQPYIKRLGGRVYPTVQPYVNKLQTKLQASEQGGATGAAPGGVVTSTETDEEARRNAAVAAMQRHSAAREDEPEV